MEVVDKEIYILPETEEECSKCGHLKAYYWTIQTRAGDELIFLNAGAYNFITDFCDFEKLKIEIIE